MARRVTNYKKLATVGKIRGERERERKALPNWVEGETKKETVKEGRAR